MITLLGDLRAGQRDATGSPHTKEVGGMLSASVTALRDASENPELKHDSCLRASKREARRESQ